MTEIENGKLEFYRRLGRPMGVFSLERRWQDVLHDKKWKKFLKMSRLFSHLPFTDFVLAAGSMALGNVRPDSDFDVIVGCRSGRIFTARFFSVLAFGLFGWRRKRTIPHSFIGGAKGEAADKICFNHFVTEKSYRLSPPYNLYWRELYKELIPISGDPRMVKRFFQANDWTDADFDYLDDQRHLFRQPSALKNFLEAVFSGGAGDWLEKILKAVQIRRIERNLQKEKPGFAPRIKYGDEELEFHPDTARIAKLTENL